MGLVGTCGVAGVGKVKWLMYAGQGEARWIQDLCLPCKKADLVKKCRLQMFDVI